MFSISISNLHLLLNGLCLVVFFCNACGWLIDIVIIFFPFINYIVSQQALDYPLIRSRTKGYVKHGQAEKGELKSLRILHRGRGTVSIIFNEDSLEINIEFVFSESSLNI